MQLTTTQTRCTDVYRLVQIYPIYPIKEAVMATKTKKNEGPSVAEQIAAKQALTGAGTPGHVRAEIDARVCGIDNDGDDGGELHVYTDCGYATIEGDVTLNAEGVHQLVRVLEQVRQATA